jgi:hypothetical protein
MATWNIRFKESAHENHHCDIRLLLDFIGKVQQADKELLVFERVFQVAITGLQRVSIQRAMRSCSMCIR